MYVHNCEARQLRAQAHTHTHTRHANTRGRSAELTRSRARRAGTWLGFAAHTRESVDADTAAAAAASDGCAERTHGCRELCDCVRVLRVFLFLYNFDCWRLTVCRGWLCAHIGHNIALVIGAGRCAVLARATTQRGSHDVDDDDCHHDNRPVTVTVTVVRRCDGDFGRASHTHTHTAHCRSDGVSGGTRTSGMAAGGRPAARVL